MTLVAVAFKYGMSERNVQMIGKKCRCPRMRIIPGMRRNDQQMDLLWIGGEMNGVWAILGGFVVVWGAIAVVGRKRGGSYVDGRGRWLSRCLFDVWRLRWRGEASKSSKSQYRLRSRRQA